VAELAHQDNLHQDTVVTELKMISQDQYFIGAVAEVAQAIQASAETAELVEAAVALLAQHSAV
jgi:hypothetical protein